MCIFSAAVEDVSQTSIFARGLPDGRQALVYKMRVRFKEDLAMVLPLPVPPGSPENAVRFVDLSGYPDFFEKMASAFRSLYNRGGGVGGARWLVEGRPTLAVHAVGSYEASFVPSPDDFERLDPRFQLPMSTFDLLPQYRDYGFAVYKLRAEFRSGGSDQREQAPLHTYHPMALLLPRRDPEALFFPTVHIHDGQVHETAEFDHMLYCQLPDEQARDLDERWVASQGSLGRWVDGQATHSLLEEDAPGYRCRLAGRLLNQDISFSAATLREELHAEGTRQGWFAVSMMRVPVQIGSASPLQEQDDRPPTLRERLGKSLWPARLIYPSEVEQALTVLLAERIQSWRARWPLTPTRKGLAHYLVYPRGGISGHPGGVSAGSLCALQFGMSQFGPQCLRAVDKVTLCCSRLPDLKERQEMIESFIEIGTELDRKFRVSQ